MGCSTADNCWKYSAQCSSNSTPRVLAATPELLDEDLLTGSDSPSDDIVAAKVVFERYRRFNNYTGGLVNATGEEDVDVSVGYVAEATESGVHLHMDETGPFNALRAVAIRTPRSQWPLHWLVGADKMPTGPRAIAESCAVLDDKLVGFRPRTNLPAPVAPLAVDVQAWWNNRPGDAYPAGGDGVPEVFVTMHADARSLALVGLAARSILD